MKAKTQTADLDSVSVRSCSKALWQEVKVSLHKEIPKGKKVKSVRYKVDERESRESYFDESFLL